MQSHFYRLILAFLGTILGAGWRFHASRIYGVITVAILTFGFFNYYHFDSKTFFAITDYADITYYYVNSKYFRELGYFELFPAMIIADHEKANHLADLKRYRDLHSYEVVNIEHALQKEAQIKERFSPQRWQAFQHDIDYLLQRNVAGDWDYFFQDHGYNPPPTWTLVGGTLSNLIAVEHLKVLAMPDFVLIGLMFWAIGWAFGTQGLTFSLLFFLCTFSGRWPVVGQSLLRFDWLVALIASACCLKKNRPVVAGILLTYSALNRVFPVLFFWPVMVAAIHHFVLHRRIATEHQKFFIASFLTAAVLLLLSFVMFGSSSFVESKQKLAMHASPQSYSSHRVGLGTALTFRGERSFGDLRRNGGIGSKAQDLVSLLPILYGLGFCSLAWIAFYTLRSGKPSWEILPLCILPIFLMQTPQVNYFNMRLLLVMNHTQDLRATPNKIALVLLFLIEAVAQASHVSGNWRYTTMAYTSIGLTIYFLFLIFYLSRDAKCF